MKNLTKNEDKELVQSSNTKFQKEIDWNGILKIIKDEIKNKGGKFNGNDFKRGERKT
ncbi:MAG: hypothetical protein ACRC0Y_11665 [Fusobacteriaceae bacterium]